MTMVASCLAAGWALALARCAAQVLLLKRGSFPIAHVTGWCLSIKAAMFSFPALAIFAKLPSTGDWSAPWLSSVAPPALMPPCPAACCVTNEMRLTDLLPALNHRCSRCN